MKWILLRGLAREARHWGDFPQTIIDTGLGEAAYAIDAPGAGLKSAQFSPISIEGYVKHMRPEFQTIRRQNPGPWGIIGISMGAMMGMKWLEQYPQDFSCGVFINTSASNFSSPIKRMSLRTMKNIVRLLFDKGLEEREKFIFQLTSHLSSTNELEKVAEWVKYARENPISHHNFLSQLIAAARFKAPKSLSVPSMFFVSEKDQLADADCGKKLASHFKAHLAIHDEAGHDLPLDDPTWVCDETKKFINSIDLH